MGNWFFWQNWDFRDSALYRFLLLAMFISFGMAAYGFFAGSGLAYPISTSNSAETFSLILDVFKLGLFRQRVDAESYYILQFYNAGEFRALPWLNMTCLIGIWLGISVLLAAVTKIQRLWYLAATGAFVVALTRMPFELLEPFGLDNKIPVTGIALLYVFLSYYFHAYGTETSMVRRFGAFILLTAVVGVFFFTGTNLPHPESHLLAHSMALALILAIFFLLMVAIDIPAFIFCLVSDTNTGDKKSNALWHYLAFMVLWLGYLGLSLAKQQIGFQAPITPIHPILLWTLAAIIGIWMYKKKEDLYEEIMSFKLSGAMVYAGLFIVTCSLLTWMYCTANDSPLAAFTLLVPASQFCFGLLFFIYSLVNFGDLMNKGLRLSTVVFKPRTFPMLMVQAAGLLGVFSIFMYKDRLPYYQALAGISNAEADAYYADNNFDAAEHYYLEAIHHTLLSNHANFCLAGMARDGKNAEQLRTYYDNALLLRPEPQTWLAYSSWLRETGQQAELPELMNRARSIFPDDPYILNNLAVSLALNNQTEVGLALLDRAGDAAGEGEETILANKLALRIRGRRIEKPDTATGANYSGKNIAVICNRAAWMNLLKMPYKGPAMPRPDSTLEDTHFCALYNLALNARFKPDTTISPVIEYYAKKDTNRIFRDVLQYGQAVMQYYSGNTARSFGIMQTVADRTQSPLPFITDTYGKWQMQYGQFEAASRNLERTRENGGSQNLLSLAIARTEYGDRIVAPEMWKQLESEAKDSNDIVHHILPALAVEDNLQLLKADELTRLEAIHFKPDLVKPGTGLEVLGSFTNAEYRSEAAADLAEYFFSTGQIAEAEAIVNETKAAIEGQSDAISRLDLIRLEILNTRSDFAGMQAMLDKGTYSGAALGRAYLFQALCFEHEGKKEEASVNMLKSAEANPFNTETAEVVYRVLNADNKPGLAYEILLRMVLLHPDEVPVRKLYTLQCIRLGLYMFAGQSLERLDYKLDNEKFNAFKAQCDSLSMSLGGAF
ncbi:MAG: hypothetical protein V4543_04325 [Bacteroidota bacterium]